MLQRAGLPATDAVAAAAVQATAGNLVLGGLFLTGVAALLASGDDVGSYLPVALGVVVVALLVTWLGWLLLRRGSALADRLRGRARRSKRRVPADLVQALSDRLLALRQHPGRTELILLCAAGNWLLDASVLWLMLNTLGQTTSLLVVLVVYGLANLLAALPLTPGGLGIVEGVMIPALMGFGVSSAPALVAVLGWRFLQFWLPVPVAAITYLSLRVTWRREERNPSSTSAGRATVTDRAPRSDPPCTT